MPTETFFNLPSEKRQLILDVAMEEFAENDFKNASITRLVAKAGIAKGSIYQYFDDKEDLFRYLVQLAVAEKKAFFQGAGPPDLAVGFFATLRWMFAVGLEFEFSNPRLAQIGYRAVYGDTPLPGLTTDTARRLSIEMFRPLIERGMADGEINPAIDSELAAVMVYGLMSQLGDFLLTRIDVPAEDLRDMGAAVFDRPGYWETIDKMFEILEYGLRAKVEETAHEREDKDEMVEQ